MLKCFFLFQFHTACCFNNIMVYFMSLFGVYSSRILSTVAMLWYAISTEVSSCLAVYIFICLMTPHFLCFYVILIYSFLRISFFSFHLCVLPSSFLSFSFCPLFTFCLCTPSFSISVSYRNNFIKMMYVEEGGCYSAELIQQWSVLCTRK